MTIQRRTTDAVDVFQAARKFVEFWLARTAPLHRAADTTGIDPPHHTRPAAHA